MKNFTISVDKDLVDIDLLLEDEPYLPEALRQLNLCDAFTGMLNGRKAAVCLLAKRKNYHEIVYMSVSFLQEESAVINELLLYIADYVRVQGGRFLEIGVGNAELNRHALLINLGFRVVGVWSNYFARNGMGDVHQQGRPTNLDLIRYRIDLNELQPK